MGIAGAIRTAMVYKLGAVSTPVVVVATRVEGEYCWPTRLCLIVKAGVLEDESRCVRWPPMRTTPVARRAPTTPADHAPARDGDAAIQLRRAERASGLTGMACSPRSEGCRQRRSSGGRRGAHQPS